MRERQAMVSVQQEAVQGQWEQGLKSERVILPRRMMEPEKFVLERVQEKEMKPKEL
jgi:hypothetical protein